ncbi:bifunctional GNAT family N-acetyltransferase/carbon-nitrogen hydrolase family protein [Robiginitomaculum antarcticum]|uniref:bifunctional GNAT family N-acetyltransferase/carbon-nitrogen hydrolase family protein n=1 Tax=Robiginitomaculum antarcticum TaxID=437507 RepID=UPI0003790F94|nr:bifunctional GNAT family N-acetyltransferase/carbon-nitrogen hydrolase family protein [Robiginitomaculum antarcticum]
MAQKRVTAQLTIRTATSKDVRAIAALVDRAYPVMGTYPVPMLKGQISNFAEGQFVVEYEGEIVGYAASIMLREDVALAPHNWAGITGGGYGSSHNPNGEWLYGMEICVDPARRRLRIGERLYDARKALVESLELKGIVFGGRMPGWAKRKKAYPDPMDYLLAVKDKKVSDPVVNFQYRQGFEPFAILENYLPVDKESGGFAAQMMWRNAYAPEVRKSVHSEAAQKDVIRVATVQLQMRKVTSFEDFMSSIEYFVDSVTAYKSDFVVFPELFTLPLLALAETRLSPSDSIEKLTEYTPVFIEAMRKLAVSYNTNIIGGSHPTRTDDGDVQNIAYVFLRDGSVHAQEKIHPTPNERHYWNIKGGDEVSTIDTDCGPIGVLICYDSEFPELARRMADEGARILFVPFCTDNRQGYLRVRYCSQARAIENQCYVVLSGNVGNLPGVENMDVNYAESCILTPCDFPFARDGIAAECSENVETVAIADLDLTDLSWARANGTVRNLRDRRFDLYQTQWSDL